MRLVMICAVTVAIVAGCRSQVTEPKPVSDGGTNSVRSSVVQPVTMRFAWRRSEAEELRGNIYFVDGRRIGNLESLKKYLSEVPSGSTLRSEMPYMEPVGLPRDPNYPDEPGLREFCRERGIRIATPLSM